MLTKREKMCIILNTNKEVVHMSKKQRRKFSGEEKVTILKRHLLNKDAVSDICDELSISPNQFYRWSRCF
jgi:transposase-like protein